MPDFLKSVRLIKVESDAPDQVHAPHQPDTSQTTIETGNGKVTAHKHSDSGDAFLAVPICAIVFTFIYLIVKAVMAPFTQRAKDRRAMQSGGGGGLTQEEVAVLHKLQRTLSQMESRVEALETILIEQSRTEKNYGSKL